MTLPLKVLGDRVLVKPDTIENAPERLQSGILLAKSMASAVTGEDVEQSVTRGTVIAVGNPKHPRAEGAIAAANILRKWVADYPPFESCDDYGNSYEDLVRIADLLDDLVRREPCCAVGDDVLFAYDAGQKITLDDETFILLHENDLLAVVEPEKELTHG